MIVKEIIFSLFGGIFQGIATSVILDKMTNKLSKKKFLILFLSLSIYGTISILFISNEIRFISFLTATSIILYFVLNVRDKKVILYSFTSEIIIAVSEIISTISLTLVGINSEQLITNYKYNMLINIMVSLLVISIGLTKVVMKNINIIIDKINKNKKLIRFFYLFILILYILVLKNGFELLLKSNYYINVILIIGMIIILVIMISNELKKEILKEQYHQMLSYVTKYEKIITEQGKANHEFKNQLMVIKGYAEMNNTSKLKEYLDSVIKESRKMKSNYLIKELNKFPDGGIKGLLYYKLTTIEEEKIEYIIDVDSDVKERLNNLDVSEYKNITKILGVLLDNAIESSRKAKEKQILIEVETKANNVEFKISNTYKGKIDINKIGTGYSSKGLKRGYGLRLVKDITSENSKYNVENYLENKYYVSVLIIKK